MSLPKRIIGLPLLALALTLSGCALMGPRGAQATVTPIPRYQATATLFPTVTPLPATATPAPTSTPVPTQPPEAERIVVEMTEAEVNEYLAGESFSQQGASISDLKVNITPARMKINGYVQHQSTGFAGDLTISGTPKLVNGALYFQVASVELGPQFSGLVRTIAQSMIQEAIRQESGTNGIPIPVTLPEGMTITQVTLGEGKLLLEGMRN